MNKKDLFKIIRRAYRVAHSTPILVEGAIVNRIAATSVLRAFTGKWDNCEPYGRTGTRYQHSARRTAKGNRCGSPVVYAACTRWMKNN